MADTEDPQPDAPGAAPSGPPAADPPTKVTIGAPKAGAAAAPPARRRLPRPDLPVEGATAPAVTAGVGTSRPAESPAGAPSATDAGPAATDGPAAREGGGEPVSEDAAAVPPKDAGAAGKDAAKDAGAAGKDAAKDAGLAGQVAVKDAGAAADPAKDAVTPAKKAAAPGTTVTGTAPTAQVTITRTWVERLVAEPYVHGPRVRMGMLWFVLIMLATWRGPIWVAVLVVPIAAFGALQANQGWRRARVRSSKALAALGAGALALSGLGAPALPGAALLGLVVLSVVVAGAMAIGRRNKPGRFSLFESAATTVRCAAPVGLAAAGLILSARTDTPAALELVVLVSFFEMGYYLWGSEGSGPVVGVLGGAIGTLAVATAIWAAQLPPFDGTMAAWVFGGTAAVGAALGLVIASAALPSARTWVPGFRRLDAYMLTTWLWLWLLWRYLV